MAGYPEHSFNTRRALVIVGIVVLLGVVGVTLFVQRSHAPDVISTPTANRPTPIPGEHLDEGEPYQLDVHLSEGQAGPPAVEELPRVTGEPLTTEEIELVLSRLPALTLDSIQQVEFNRPAESLPPPRTGETVTETFPPLETEATPGQVDAGPLQVLRYSPQGDVPLAPFISVTFNQPMVAVGTLADLAAADVPVQVEPSMPGTWRWLGTRTLTFKHDSELIDRLPMATEYRLTVPAGTLSASGEALAEAVTWTFTTPPPTLLTYYPHTTPQPLEPIFFIGFDQRIDPEAVLEMTHVIEGREEVEIELATQEEIEKDEWVRYLIESAEEGRWLAFRAVEPLTPDTNISVTIEPGTPSAEGPLTTLQSQTYSFSTYAPLRIEDHGCSWYDDRCPPLTPLYIQFNNPLDMEVFSDELLTVEPEIPGMSIDVYGNSIGISGQTQGRTTYTVTVSEDIQDVFGQTLGKDERLTFKVDKSDPILIGPQQNFVTLDPSSSKPVFSVYAINYNKLDTKIYSVQPSDWTDFKNYVREWQWTDRPPEMPGTLLSDRAIRLDLPQDTLTQVDIDLDQYMSGDSAQFVVIVEPPTGIFDSDEEKWIRYSQTVIAWVQVTKIGLDAYADHSEMVAWATDLETGAPLAGVRIQPSTGSTSVGVATGSDGVARFNVPSGATYLIAEKGADQAMLPRSPYAWDQDAWNASPPNDTLRWYVFDDRKMYRPGEEVHVKGWLRRIGGQQDGDVGLVGSELTSVSYQIRDPMGNDLGGGQADVNSLGGFDFAFSLPQNANLGLAYLYLRADDALAGLDGREFHHEFQIQEFRRPEFEVTTRAETEGPYFAGDQATVAVEAKYYAGGPLPNADVTWTVTTSTGNYSPPNWPDFTFGNWTPWWWYFEYQEFGGEVQTETFTSRTDASGTHLLNLDFQVQGDQAVDPEPKSVVAEASVMDVNRQAWASSTALLVHPADVYIGIRSEKYFVERDEPLEVQFIVTDLDGNPVSDRPVQITAARSDWEYRNGEWVELEVDRQTCSLISGPQPAACIFETPIGGSYQITATVSDESGRQNQSQFTRWVTGGELPPSRNVEQEEVTLVPDRETYQPGDTAKILVQSPFAPAEGLLTVSRSGILYTERFRIEDGSVTLSIPINEQYIPNLNIQVDLTGSAPRTDDTGQPLANVPPRPAFATAQLNLSIPPLERTLSVEVTPDQNTLVPGSETTLTVMLKDAHGEPVSDAEVAVVVVDEAILALTDYSLADPITVFYSDRPSYVYSTYGRASVVLADPQSLAAQPTNLMQREAVMDGAFLAGAPAPSATEAPAMAEEDAGYRPEDPAQAIDVRADFNPLANFSPTVRTGSNGEARVYVKLPDNLTRYRVMSVAVDRNGNQFGTGESNLTAQLPLMVRPSAPRFLNFGDTFELPVVLQNQTDEPMTVEVIARATNLEIGYPLPALPQNGGGSGWGLRVTVPANDRVEVRFPSSTVMAGTAQIQLAAVSGEYADAATVTLPVYTPATSEAFAVYGVIDEGALAQPVQYPSDVFPQFGGLEINTSSTALQALTDAMLYLVDYPFESSESLSSRIMAVASLRDVLTAFEAEGMPSPAEMEAAVDRDIERLRGLQNDDGGFPYWRRGFDSIPFNTIHVTHALLRAREKGFDVPSEMLEYALYYLRDIESYYPEWYSQETRWTLSAYALSVRDLAGDRDAQKAQNLLNEAGLENLSMEAIGWLWSVIDDSAQLDAIRVHVNNHAVETAGAANFSTYYSDQTYLLLSSDRRTDAILLDALIEDNLQSDLIPKVVNGLLAHRVKGHWNSTQEDVFVLLALDRYFNTYEAETPDFVARIWLGNVYAGSGEFRERTTERHETFIPMNYVLSETSAGGGTENLILSKDGPGRLYYRLGLRYAPTDLQLDPLDMGFVIQRTYEGIDDPDDVTQDSDGVWHIKAGSRVRVTITMVADNRRYHVALVDPLPAGLEIVNPELAVSGSVPQNPSDPGYRYGWWWWGPWYEHQNTRDDRAEAFTSLLWDGVYEYTYVARATTPGTFVVPPAKAEEMYSPEVFGRSGSDWVIVEDRE
ncbi:MAG: Ig-like domain-containing protein [Chloroflexota bacterium]